MLGWTPDTFWRATPHEFYPATRGLREYNGADQEANDALTREEFEMLKRRFPD